MRRVAMIIGVVGALCAGAWGELTPEQTKQAEELIAQFGAAQFAAREEAVKKLIAMGSDALPLVQKTLAETKDPEVRLRCQMAVRALALGKPEAQHAPEPETTLDERVVKELGPVKWPLCYSRDGSRVAARMERGKQFTVLVDGEETRPYEKVGAFGALSGDGKRLCYLVKEADMWFVVTDGMEGKKYAEVDVPVFSSDANTVAYRATTPKGECMVINGVEGPVYNSVTDKPVFSPDGKRLAYTANRDGKNFMVLDGHEAKVYLGVGNPVFSNDGKHVAYWGQRDEGYFMVVDGVEGKPIYADCGDPEFSNDGKHMAYGAMKKTGKWCLVVDGKESGSYDHIGMGDMADVPHFSPDGSRLACQVWHGSKRYMLIDGKETGPYDKIGVPTFSPDNKHVAHMADRGGRWRLVCDGREGKEYDGYGPEGVVFSPDSKHVGFIAEEKQRWLMVVDGIETTTYWWVNLPGGCAETKGKLRYNTMEDEHGLLMELDWPKGVDWTNGLKAVEVKDELGGWAGE